MYQESQEVLNKGLSPFSRWLLGTISGLFGVVMILIAPEMAKPIAIYLFGAFCIIIFLMCVTTGKIRNRLGRVIGITTFLLSAFYFVNEIFDGKIYSGSQSEPSIINSIFFFFAFGLPGLRFAIKGRFFSAEAEQNVPIFEYDEISGTIVFSDETKRIIPWGKVIKIEIVTTDQGPWEEDVWWLFFLEGIKEPVDIPQDAKGNEKIFDVLENYFENVNMKEIQKAMGSTSNAKFDVWQRNS